MKIAVALFGERISPNFSTAPELLILVTQEGSTPCSWKAPMEGMSSRQRAIRLLSMGVDVLLCGGIDRATRVDLERKGVRVVSDLAGDPMKAVFRLLDFGAAQEPVPFESGKGVIGMGGPRKRDQGEAQARKARSSSPKGETNGERAPLVMVLMAYKPVGALLEALLKEEGLEALECCSAGEALKRLKSSPTPLVITDPADLIWQDPQIRELTGRLREARVIAFTSLSRKELEEMPLRFAAIVSKSSNLEPLVKTVKSLRGGP